MKQNKQFFRRLLAVAFWLAVWQIAAMALAAVYPHGELLLASPADVLLLSLIHI